MQKQVDDLEIIRKTRELLSSSDRWVQNDLVRYTFDEDYNEVLGTSYCLLGGIGKAIGWEDNKLEDAVEEDVIEEAKIAAQIMSDVISKHYPQRTRDPVYGEKAEDPHILIPLFNDHSKTTFEDVQRVLRITEGRIKRRVNKEEEDKPDEPRV